MRRKQFLLFGLGLIFIAGPALAQTNPTNRPPPVSGQMISVNQTNYLGLVTNGPALMHLYQITQSWTNPTPVRNPIMATNPYFMKMRQSNFSWTNAVFDSFIPGSLNHAIWTNFMALTNGRTLQIWSERLQPQAWTDRPVVRWNTNSVLWGMTGLTALSPCWQVQTGSGQVPFTALTRRHAYSRGHGMGTEGFQTSNAGRKVWFVTRNNVLVEAVIKRHVTRASVGKDGVHRDYTIALFDRDLPDAIETMRVATMAEVQSKYPFSRLVNCPQPIFQTEQGGYVSTGIAPLVVNTWKPGDSGSPNLVPLPGELIFLSGRSSSGPSREMQEDMDELCRLEKLKPEKYQMRSVDLSKYPAY